MLAFKAAGKLKKGGGGQDTALTLLSDARTARALRTYLTNSSDIRELNLSKCKLTDATSMQLAKGLRENASLVALNLSNNLMGASAGHALGRALSVNTTLVRLDVSWNSLKAEVGSTQVGQRRRSVLMLVL